MKPSLLPFVSLCATGLVACSSSSPAELAITVYGEDFVERGIEGAAFVDGWSVEFDSFVVTFSELAVGDVALDTPETMDVSGESSGAGHPLTTLDVPPGPLPEFTFTIARVRIDGVARLGDEQKTFDWTFDEPVLHRDCDLELDIDATDENRLEITLHADHLFSDSLVASEPVLRFEALARADTNDDGTITEDELRATDIGSYDPGSAGGVENLFEFLAAQSHTLGHVQGEGHCHTTKSP